MLLTVNSEQRSVVPQEQVTAPTALSKARGFDLGNAGEYGGNQPIVYMSAATDNRVTLSGLLFLRL
jgi:hypothetical protein